MRYLRTNTATRVTVGPFLDKTDGITPETALTVTGIKLTFVVDDGGVPTLVLDTNPTASGGNNDMVHITGDDAGFYDLELAAANVNYVGRAMLALTDAANHCPVFHEFMILPANIYDSLVGGTDLFDVSVTQIAGSAVSTSTAQLGVNAVQAGGTAWGSGAITAGAIASDAITAAKVAADVSAEIADAVWDELKADHTVPDSFGDYLDDEITSRGTGTALDAAGVRSAVGLAAANLDTQLAAIDDAVDTEVAAALAAVDTEVAAIKAKTDLLPSDPADQSAVEAAILAAWTTQLTEAYAADGVAPTPAQLLFMLWAAIAEFGISGTTITAKKLDGTTTAMTFTLDDATNPTSRTRAS